MSALVEVVAGRNDPDRCFSDISVSYTKLPQRIQALRIFSSRVNKGFVDR
jgi:hypothetical protein